MLWSLVQIVHKQKEEHVPVYFLNIEQWYADMVLSSNSAHEKKNVPICFLLMSVSLCCLMAPGLG